MSQSPAEQIIPGISFMFNKLKNFSDKINKQDFINLLKSSNFADQVGFLIKKLEIDKKEEYSLSEFGKVFSFNIFDPQIIQIIFEVIDQSNNGYVSKREFQEAFELQSLYIPSLKYLFLDIILTEAEIDLIFKNIPITQPNLLSLKDVVKSIQEMQK